MTLEARLLDYSEHHYADYKAEGYTLTYWVCDLCGWFRWISATNKGQGFKVAVDNLFNQRECQKCREVALRAPEVFNWVINVLMHRAGDK